MAEIRPATVDDYTSISEWTIDTFSWGDYVRHRFHGWLEEPNTEVLVCVDETDTPIALANVVQLSPNEAWMEAARVHPDHRRQGLGTSLNHAGVTWARSRGCRVMRLTTESDNAPAINQVESLGYRSVANWFYAEIDVPPTYRCEDQFRLRASTGSDAEAAWMAWTSSDLARDARELIALGWRWRKSRPEDALDAAQRGELFHSAAGWASVVEHERWLATHMMVTTPDDIIPLLDGLRDLTASRGVPELNFKLPEVAWTREVARRVGAETVAETIWAKAI